MRIRFIADYDFNGEIIEGLSRREPATDIETGHQAELEGVPDPEVLAKAARENRTLITHDRRTMPFHFAEFILKHDSPGVVIVPQQISVGPAIEQLYLVWFAPEAEEWQNRILYLPI
jgi:hypothetical protein